MKLPVLFALYLSLAAPIFGAGKAVSSPAASSKTASTKTPSTKATSTQATNTLSGLNARDFDRYWRIESESPDYRVTFRGDTVEILAPKGLTLWRREEMQGDVTIEYDACLVDEGQDGDRLSDLNCFWMASDPEATDVFTRMDWRSGIFLRCYTLQLYYMGYGGNSNGTTRFRRYTGDAAGVTDATARPAILTEYTDAAHLNVANRWRHIRLTSVEGRVGYEIDGEQLVDYRDPSPLTAGWFGFRTTWSRVRLTNFRYTATTHADEPVALRWIEPLPNADQEAKSNADPLGSLPVTFGVPFTRGAVQPASRFTWSGSDSPLDFRTLAYWPDGSVKWGGFSGAIAPAESYELRLATTTNKKKAKAAKAPVTLTETRTQYIVRTDSLTAYLPKGASSNLIDSLFQTGSNRSAATLTAVSTLVGHGEVTGRLDSTTVERCGDHQVVFRLDGHLQDGLLPFNLRLYFTAGTTQVQAVYTFIEDAEPEQAQIAALGLRFSVPLREALYNRHVAFGTSDTTFWSEPVQPLVGRRVLYLSEEEAAEHTAPHLYADQMQGRRVPERDAFTPKYQAYLDQWAAWDGFRLSQLNDMGYSLRKRAKQETPWIGTRSGLRAPGSAFVGDVSGGLAVALHDFWQSYPSTLEVSGATTAEAALTLWLWSPEAEPMDLRHYDTEAHGLDAAYEDIQPGMSTPVGIARTSTLSFAPMRNYGGPEQCARVVRRLAATPQLICSPEYLHRQHAFGIWSLPNAADTTHAWVETELRRYTDHYKQEVERCHWYGFWNYGDVMHTFDTVRNEWLYDVGGYAWDNTELASNAWLWYNFLRTGDAGLWRMAVAMTRHTSEVDVYHVGPHAGLGSRHNVTHWGCGAKEARISQAAWNRFYYYLSGGDERTGQLMTAERDADTLLYHLDPMRLAQPRSLYPCTAPARLRIGPDWLAYAGNWMTEWERTADTRYRDRILAGMESINALPHGIFTGPKALGYDPATARITYEGDTALQNTNHLLPIMGGFEIMNELLEMLPASETEQAWRRTWLNFCRDYRRKATEISNNTFRIPRLPAYAYYLTHDPAQHRQAWHELGRGVHNLYTNDVATWSLDAIYMLEVCP
jgi:hypothetical protein